MRVHQSQQIPPLVGGSCACVGKEQGMPGKSPYFVLGSAVNLTLISNDLFKREIKVLKCVNIYLILRRSVTKQLNALAGRYTWL